MRNIRLLHRIAVDWTADSFGLRGQSARARHDAARDRAYARARRLHEPREQRVLRGWQERIGRLVGADPGGRPPGPPADIASGRART